MTPAEFRRAHPVLVHYAPEGNLRLEHGLLTAAQLLDRCDDGSGQVWAKFVAQAQFTRHDVAHWKTHSRFLRGAGEAGCNVAVRDPIDESLVYLLGNNYPLGDGRCLGTTIALTDNKVSLDTRRPSDEFIECKIRLSAINGGGSNGALPRGTATYKRPSEWTTGHAPKEIGIVDGLTRALVADLGLVLEQE